MGAIGCCCYMVMVVGVRRSVELGIVAIVLVGVEREAGATW